MNFDHSDLYNFFSKVGKIVCCKVSWTIKKIDGKIVANFNGYGFVKFSNKEEVEKAITLLNSAKITD